MKRKLFTHSDLDGVGCKIVGLTAYPDLEVSICDYHNVDLKVTNFITSANLDEYEAIYITDISVNASVAELIQERAADKVRLIDHHITALWLNRKYTWAKVFPINLKEEKSSGTDLFLEFILRRCEEGQNHSNYAQLLNLRPFVEKVRRYDTWDWENVHNDISAKQLNDLFYLIGREKFVERFLSNSNPQFTEAEQMIIDLEQEKIDRYIEKKDKDMYVRNVYDGYKAGIVYAENYHSEVGNSLHKLHPELDFILIINPASRKVSLRTIHDHVNVGAWAEKHFGGGGHVKAAGFQYHLGLEQKFSQGLIGWTEEHPEVEGQLTIFDILKETETT